MSLVSHGDVAQLGEHQVRNLGVESSILFVSTIDDSIRRNRTVSPFLYIWQLTATRKNK